MIFATFFIFLCGILARSWAFDPYSPGTYQVIRVDYPRMATIGLSQNVNVWSPVEDGQFPVVFLQDSFGAFTPGDAYDDTMSHIASHGFVVVNGWRMRDALSYDDKVAQFTETIEWSKNNLEDNLHNDGASSSLTLDFSLSFAIGHSAGSHILVQYLKDGCGDFKGLVLSSPVDGYESQGQVITEGTTLNFDTPTIVLPAGLDNVKAGPNAPTACAPDEISNLHFYNALNPNSPRWLVNATEYGHGDYLDQGYVDVMVSLHFCASKEGGTTEDYILYRNFFAGEVVSFFRALIEEDCETYLPFIEDFSSMPVSATGENVNPSGGCPTAYCTWTAL